MKTEIRYTKRRIRTNLLIDFRGDSKQAVTQVDEVRPDGMGGKEIRRGGDKEMRCMTFGLLPDQHVALASGA